MAGPEEMKWPQKELYTYNVQNGDKFIIDEKVNRWNANKRTTWESPSRHIFFSGELGQAPHS